MSSGATKADGGLPTSPRLVRRARQVAKVAKVAKIAGLFMPTLLAIIYFGLIASDRYAAEAAFIVRTATKPTNTVGLGALLNMSGIGRAQDDAFAVQAFMGSRDAVKRLAAKLPLREIYGRPEADFLARYPSFAYGRSDEQLHDYLKWMISTVYNSTTGITSLKVQAFRAEDARAVAAELLKLGEETVNRLNAQIEADAIRVAQAELKRDQDRLVAAEAALTKFRNAELLIDAAASSVIVTQIIARLSAELAKTESQIGEAAASATINPTIAGLKNRSAALQAQIDRERARISAPSGGLADKLSAYERLVLDREFAKTSLENSSRAVDAAQLEAHRQQLYLERIVEPTAVDYPNEPSRIRMIATFFGINVIVLLVGWLIVSGLREHAVAA